MPYCALVNNRYLLSPSSSSITRLVISFTGLGNSVRFCKSSKLSNGFRSRSLITCHMYFFADAWNKL